MLDRDLAELYAVETRTLNQAVKRNLARFPHDFMFQLTATEAKIARCSRSQFVILNVDGTPRRGMNISAARSLRGDPRADESAADGAQAPHRFQRAAERDRDRLAPSRSSSAFLRCMPQR